MIHMFFLQMYDDKGTVVIDRCKINCHALGLPRANALGVLDYDLCDMKEHFSDNSFFALGVL